MRARKAGLGPEAPPAVPFETEGYWKAADGAVLGPDEALRGLQDPTRRPEVGTPEWEGLKAAVLDFARLLAARHDPLGEGYVALYNRLLEESHR